MIHREYRRETGADTAFLLVHGIVGCAEQMLCIDGHIEALGYDCHILLLPGHGKKSRDFARSDHRDWLTYSFACMDRLCAQYKRVYFLGHSMGGLLCSLYAAQYPDRIAGLVLLNTPVRAMVGSRQLKRILRLALPFLGTDKEAQAAYREGLGIELGRFYEYPLFLRPLTGLLILLRRAKKQMGQISVPVLLLQSQKDEVVHPKSAQTLLRRLGPAAAELTALPRSGHAYFPPEDLALLARAIARFTAQEAP